jgi:sugar (pentulose or hexulose) kinase
VGWGRGRSLLPFLGSASCCASSNALNIQTGDAVLAVDIGDTNIRAGVVQLNLKKSNTLAKAKVWKYSLWRHGDEENVKREQAIVQLGSMLKGLIGAARAKSI